MQAVLIHTTGCPGPKDSIASPCKTLTRVKLVSGSVSVILAVMPCIELRMTNHFLAAEVLLWWLQGLCSILEECGSWLRNWFLFQHLFVQAQCQNSDLCTCLWNWFLFRCLFWLSVKTAIYVHGYEAFFESGSYSGVCFGSASKQRSTYMAMKLVPYSSVCFVHAQCQTSNPWTWLWKLFLFQRLFCSGSVSKQRSTSQVGSDPCWFLRDWVGATDSYLPCGLPQSGKGKRDIFECVHDDDNTLVKL